MSSGPRSICRGRFDMDLLVDVDTGGTLRGVDTGCGAVPKGPMWEGVVDTGVPRRGSRYRWGRYRWNCSDGVGTVPDGG